MGKPSMPRLIPYSLSLPNGRLWQGQPDGDGLELVYLFQNCSFRYAESRTHRCGGHGCILPYPVEDLVFGFR
jgi:hypothetical protein